MSVPSKLLWAEAVALRVQHFQQQDRYVEGLVAHTKRALHPYAWGVLGLGIDEARLALGVFQASALSLIFRDGTVYDASASDLLPQAIKLNTVPPASQSVVVYARLPALKEHGDNATAQGEGRSSARFEQFSKDTADLFSSAAATPVRHLRKTINIVIDGDAAGSDDLIPLARLRRLATGGFELDHEFVPPSLCINATPSLSAQLTRLVEKLLAKVGSLYGRQQDMGTSAVDMWGGDTASFWLIHTASSAYAPLAHFLAHPGLHPERLFQQLLALAGGLMSYSREAKLSELPSYDHLNAGARFSLLFKMIDALLDTVIASRYTRIALTLTRPGMHAGVLDPAHIKRDTTLYLAVNANMAAMELVELMPRRLKIGAPEDVEQCITASIPGIKVVYAPQMPSAVPVRANTFYFIIESRGTLHDNMIKAERIAIFAAGNIDGLTLELLAV